MDVGQQLGEDRGAPGGPRRIAGERSPRRSRTTRPRGGDRRIGEHVDHADVEDGVPGRALHRGPPLARRALDVVHEPVSNNSTVAWPVRRKLAAEPLRPPMARRRRPIARHDLGVAEQRDVRPPAGSRSPGNDQRAMSIQIPPAQPIEQRVGQRRSERVLIARQSPPRPRLRQICLPAFPGVRGSCQASVRVRGVGRHIIGGMAVRLGSERLFDSGALRGRRVGVVCNPASVDSGFRHILDRMRPNRASRLPRSSGRSTGSGPTCRTT